MNEQRELLCQFFGGYFHEDFRCDSRGPNEVLELYVSETTLETRLALNKAILDYIEQSSGESELNEKLFHELGCYYDPRADGIYTKDWLRTIASQLTRT